MVEVLRPMSTGELMDRTLVLYKKHFRLFVGIASLGPATYLLFQLLTIGSASLKGGGSNRLGFLSAVSVGVGVVGGFLIMLGGMAISHAATVKAVAAVHLGRPIGIGEAYRSLKGRFWRVLGVFVCIALLAGLVVLGGFLMVGVVGLILRTLFTLDAGGGQVGQIFAAIIGFGVFVVIGILAIVVWTRYALSIACCVVEDLGVIKSIRRSAALSKGSRFRIFLIYIVFVILAVIFGAVLGGLAGAAGSLTASVPVRLILVYVASFIAGSLTGPLATIGIALVYYDERVRKEAFDLQLMMSSLDSTAPPSVTAVPVQS